MPDERLLRFIVADVNFDMFLLNIFAHGEILIIFGLFFVIAKYAILMFHNLMVERRNYSKIFKSETNKLFHFVVAIK